MAPMSQEDIEWFKSTFHPIPKPQIPNDSVEYSVYWIPSDDCGSGSVDEIARTGAKLREVQRTAAGFTKSFLKDYIWQREGFRLEIAKKDGMTALLHIAVKVRGGADL